VLFRFEFDLVSVLLLPPRPLRFPMLLYHLIHADSSKHQMIFAVQLHQLCSSGSNKSGQVLISNIYYVRDYFSKHKPNVYIRHNIVITSEKSIEAEKFSTNGRSHVFYTEPVAIYFINHPIKEGIFNSIINNDIAKLMRRNLTITDSTLMTYV